MRRSPGPPLGADDARARADAAGRGKVPAHRPGEARDYATEAKCRTGLQLRTLRPIAIRRAFSEAVPKRPYSRLSYSKDGDVT